MVRRSNPSPLHHSAAIWAKVPSPQLDYSDHRWEIPGSKLVLRNDNWRQLSSSVKYQISSTWWRDCSSGFQRYCAHSAYGGYIIAAIYNICQLYSLPCAHFGPKFQNEPFAAHLPKVCFLTASTHLSWYYCNITVMYNTNSLSRYTN